MTDLFLNTFNMLKNHCCAGFTSLNRVVLNYGVSLLNSFLSFLLSGFYGLLLLYLDFN